MGPQEAVSNFKDVDFNPCLDEGALSKRCLLDNAYDYNQCSYYFENYRNCKQFWQTVKRIRMHNDVKPFMPKFEERQKILKEREKGNYIYRAN